MHWNLLQQSHSLVDAGGIESVAGAASDPALLDTMLGLGLRLGHNRLDEDLLGAGRVQRESRDGAVVVVVEDVSAIGKVGTVNEAGGEAEHCRGHEREGCKEAHVEGWDHELD